MLKQDILTNKEKEVLKRKLNNQRLSKQDSYYLSRSIRPKLRLIKEINADYILKRIEYNQKSASIESKIKKLILKEVPKISAIIIYGSAIQKNYSEYNDIDVLVIIKEKTWRLPKDKYKIINELNKKSDIKLDIQIMTKEDLLKQYPHNPSLIYQLTDSKIIYGKLKLPRKIEIYNADLRMKMDWTMEDENLKGMEIYRALRNVFLVRLIMNKIISNQKLNDSINREIGETLINKLKGNKESKKEREIAMYYLRNLVSDTYKNLGGNLWEKRVVLKV